VPEMLKMLQKHFRDLHGGVVIASGCESEGLGFKPRQLQATFDPGLAKKSNKNILSLKVCL